MRGQRVVEESVDAHNQLHSTTDRICHVKHRPAFTYCKSSMIIGAILAERRGPAK